MGVVYKLAPKIRDFILESKKTEPNLSCRQLAILILDKFQIKVSKSSVNSVIKNTGLSMSVGRRRKKRKYTLKEKPAQPPLLLAAPEVRPEEIQIPAEKPEEAQVLAAIKELPAEIEGTGAILLKAADYLLDGSRFITEIIQNRLNYKEENLAFLVQGLIYLPLFPKDILAKDPTKIWALMDKGIPFENIREILSRIQEQKTVGADFFRILSTILQETRGVKISLSDASILYLDGQLHTVWSTPDIPYDFSTTLADIKNSLYGYLKRDFPFLLFMAPGYDTPTKEFFDFLLALESKGKRISKLTLYGNKFEERENIPVEKEGVYSYIFGLWPWQFSGYRKVKTIAEFRPYRHLFLKDEFYLADIEIELSQPTLRQILSFRGCALKRNLNEKIKLVVLTNPAGYKPAEEIADIYLCRWPNIEEALGDYNRKIELFTYTANSQHFLSPENLPLDKQLGKDLEGLLAYYLQILDLYIRWHFLPLGYENKEFALTQKEFYALDCRLKKEKDFIRATFIPPVGYAFLKDLEYACRRINEKEVLFGTRRLCCEVK